MDGTFNENSFNREYMSKWTGETENAFFNSEIIDRVRRLNQPEYEYSGRSSRSSEYIISADVGRKGCSTVITIFKNIPQPNAASIKSLVNVLSYDDTHFEDQAIILKKLFYKYNARRIVIDGNGVGLGLVDYMIKTQINQETGEIYPDFGVYNDDDGYYKKYRSPACVLDAIYIIKANAQLNTEMHVNAQNQLTSGRINLLINETVAKNKLMQTKMGQSMTPEQREEYLRPFVLTSILKDEMLNLREENEGINIILKQANKAIKKDKFSAFEYGLFYIKEEEEKKKKKKRFNAKDWLFLN